MKPTKARWVTIAVVLFLTAGMYGCATVVTEVLKKAWEDRTTQDQVTDTKIMARMLEYLLDKDKGLLLDISVDAWERRVMLTGTLDDSKIRDEIVSFAKEDIRITILYNEILIVSPEEKERLRKEREEEKKDEEGGMFSDLWIETKILAQLLPAKKITSVNYRWRSVTGRIFVIGRAADDLEKSYALELIKSVEGVKSVKEFIEIK